ncbi:DEAD/DEAH box helicase [Pelotomaculum propionicicum]|uniref:Putative DNA repair helicase RadD n=1 Tax=Pelotomaculum propionicicum TaxID=258475 RepID=A0A4Y7RKS6_9FIRM|nr:DEAD/DEAH box helicase [Pelotomaculum propionicicum]NLI12965.1 DEAD/DEAH box helicase [Peptococcaceae bacterium]TEB09339.1 putative DNA repair helicase RadD [Pelotomaculum propionicicum]
MDVFPNQEEIEVAADLLVNTYSISPQMVRRLLGERQRDEANGIMHRFKGESMTKLDLVKLLIMRKGSELFAGSSEEVKDLRFFLLSKLPDDKIAKLFEEHGQRNNSISSPSHMRRPLSQKPWHANGRWSNAFVEAVGFPKIFAGVLQRDSLPTVDNFDPLSKLPELVEFQKDLKLRMLKVLEQEGDKTRCVVTLPTGGGKTRVAVEAFIEWMQKRFANGQYMIWIAQSEELCEQALTCIKDMWGSREYVSSLRVYRYYGGREVPEKELKGGAVVASIQQIHNRIKSEDPVLMEFLKKCGAMIIDEAHRAVTDMYDVLLNKAEQLCGSDLFPICGLTATPGRAGINKSDEIGKLVNRFEFYLIKPNLGEEYSADPVKYFRENGYLANPRHIVCEMGKEYELTDSEIEQMAKENDVPAGFRKRLAWDRDRNIFIIKRLLKIKKGCPTIVYACTVEHAYFLSVMLTATGGRHTAAVSSDTPMTIRRGIIRDFKNGKIDFLFNYGVLTTGFDAPKTECIAICRPTTSEILYEQILGRGLRGPAFKGTKECLVIDFADNIKRLGKPLAYARFKDFWTEESFEDNC